eukprot:4214825-Amphidinium_carterae.1
MRILSESEEDRPIVLLDKSEKEDTVGGGPLTAGRTCRQAGGREEGVLPAFLTALIHDGAQGGRTRAKL